MVEDIETNTIETNRMRLLLILAVLIFGAETGYSQYESELDVLSKQISEGSFEDASKTIRSLERNYRKLANVDATFMVLKGQYYASKYKFKKSIDAFNKAVVIDSGFYTVSEFGKVYYLQGNYSKAAEYLEKAYRINSLDIINNKVLIQVYLDMNEYGLAKKIIVTTPTILYDKDLWSFLWKCHIGLGEWNEALPLCEQILQYDSVDYCFCSYESYLSLRLYDSIPQLIPIMMTEPLMEEKDYISAYTGVFYESLLVYAGNRYEKDGDFGLFDSTVREGRKFGNPELFETSPHLLRHIGRIYYSNEMYWSAYYYLSYIEKLDYYDYLMLVSIGNKLNEETWLLKKAKRKLEQK